MKRFVFLILLLNLQTVVTAAAAATAGSDEQVQIPTYVFHRNSFRGIYRFTLNPYIQNSYYFGLDLSKSAQAVCCGKFPLDAACWIEKPTFKKLVEMALKNDEESLDSFIKSREGPEEKKVFLKLFLKQLSLTSGPNNPENRKMLTDFIALNC